MTKLISVSFKNFQSYGSSLTTVPLTKKGTTMIIGENLDDGGSNGVGKSTIINAISYGLYDKPISDISKDGLINNINGKNMEVIVEFEKNNNKYRVRRYRKMKGNGIELFENDNEITPDSISNTNKMIEQIINMPHDLFVRVIVFSAINTQFLNLPMRDQANMLEDLLDLKMLSDKAIVLKERIKDTTRSLEIEDENIIQANKDCHRFHIQYQRAYERADIWNAEHKHNIDNIKIELKELKKVDIEKQTELTNESDRIINVTEDVRHSIELIERDIDTERGYVDALATAHKKSKKWITDNNKSIAEAQKELDILLNIDVTGQLIWFTQFTTNNSLSCGILKEQSILTDAIASRNKTIETNVSELEHLQGDKCPYCKQHFADNKQNIKQCTRDIAAANKENELFQVELQKCVDENNLIQIKIEEAQDNLKYSKDELDDININIIRASERVERIKTAENGWLDPIVGLEQKVDAADIASLELLLTERQKEINELDEKLDAIQEIRIMGNKEISAHKQKLAIAETKLSELKKQENSYQIQFDELEQDIYDKENNIKYIDIFKQSGLPVETPFSIFSIVNGTEEYVFINGTDRSDQLHKFLDHQKFLLKLLTNKNSFIRKTMLNQSIPFLNKQLDVYLKIMGLPHSVVFTPKMEVEISRLGKTLQYGNLSNGQACRVNLALSFAFRDVLQYLHDPINVWVLDEVLDVGLDSNGIQQAAAMIKQKAKNDKSSIFVISHRDEIAHTFDNTITVQLKDGFSSIP